VKKAYIAAWAVLAAASGCSSPEGIITPVLPYDPADEGWKAVENFEHSFNMKDLALLEETLDPTFAYLLPEEDWADYDGDGIIDICFNEEYYLQTVSNVFQTYEIIEFTLYGNGETTWPGDPSGQTMQYERTYDIWVYNWAGGEPEGWRRQGEAVFLCRPDSSGIWRITRLDDLFETEQ